MIYNFLHNKVMVNQYYVVYRNILQSVLPAVIVLFIGDHFHPLGHQQNYHLIHMTVIWSMSSLSPTKLSANLYRIIIKFTGSVSMNFHLQLNYHSTHRRLWFNSQNHDPISINLREIFKNEDRDFLHPGTRSPRTPPPSCPILRKKINPHFFLEIESLIAKTNFTLGPIEKSIFLVQL